MAISPTFQYALISKKLLPNGHRPHMTHRGQIQIGIDWLVKTSIDLEAVKALRTEVKTQQKSVVSKVSRDSVFIG